MNISELEKKLHKNSVELVRFCKSHNKIYIYGAGEYAANIAHYLDVEGIEYDGFVVSKPSENASKCWGKVVYGISELASQKGNGFVRGVSDKYVNEVYDELSQHGITWEDTYMEDVFHDRPQVLGGMIPDVGRIGACFDLSSPNGYFIDCKELDSLGEKHKTDKRSGFHNYLNKYEFFLNKYRNEKLTLMELGVFNGSSVRMWEEYFSQAEIVGVDIDDKCKQYESSRIKIVISDLSNPDNINNLKRYSPKIIIDDASHKWSHQILAISILMDSVPSGGVYICEDLETSFPASRNLVYSDASVSAYQFLSAIAEIVTGREYLTREWKDPALYDLKDEIEEIAQQIEMISFLSGSCVMIKK